MDDWILLIDESRDAGLQRLIADAALSAGVKEVIAQDSENVWTGKIRSSYRRRLTGGRAKTGDCAPSL
jgi:hypothetical protein